MPQPEIFDAIDAHEERHFSSLLETVLLLPSGPEKFLQRVREKHGTEFPLGGRLSTTREQTTGKRRPDFLITNGSNLLVMIENKVVVESVSTGQIREGLEDGYRMAMELNPTENARRFVYLYVAPEPLHVDFDRLRPQGSHTLPVDFTALHIPLREIPALFDWVKDVDAGFYADAERYLAFLLRSATMEPLDDAYATMVEALAREGLDRLQSHLADFVRMVTQIAEGVMTASLLAGWQRSTSPRTPTRASKPCGCLIGSSSTWMSILRTLAPECESCSNLTTRDAVNGLRAS